jgi:hypothetical protein
MTPSQLPQRTYTALIVKTMVEQAVPAGLESKIMSRIARSHMNRARLYISLHAASIIIAVIACVPVMQSFMISASQSGFTSYLSLLASDGSSIMSSWKDLAFSIIESMPIIETALILALLLVIGNALRRGARSLTALAGERHMLVLT